jgi:predicted Zn-dependent peptidase
MSFQTSTLSNGLRVIMNKNNSTPTATIIAMVNVGSNWETPEINGIAHYLEHLFFKGTKKRPTQRLIALELEKYGAISNAFTSREITCYHIKVNYEHLEKIIEILGDILSNSLYKKQELDTEKKVVLNEINQRMSSPSYVLDREFNKCFFKNLPNAKSVSGTSATVSKITRDMVFAFLYRFYRPENMIISVAGNFKSYPYLMTLLEKHLNNLYHHNYLLTSKTFTNTLEKLNNNYDKWQIIYNLQPNLFINSNEIILNNHIIPKMDLNHSFIVIGFNGCNYQDENKMKNQLLSIILGGTMSSRLFNIIRDKYGLVYSISSSHNANNKNGVFTIEYSCNHDKKIQIKILKLIKKEIELIKNELITKKDLDVKR